MNNYSIGVFDSGCGGLTAVKAIRELMPDENIIYLGDTARIPYGTKSNQTIVKYAQDDIEFLTKHNVKMIIVACGTVSAVMMSNPIYNGDLPFTGVLLPTVKAAAAATKNGRIGVIGTPTTIKSDSYTKILHEINPSLSVTAQGCPLFVPLVENGYTDKGNKIATLVAEEYLSVMKKDGVDTLILGCTHYPLLTDIIRDIMGDDVTLISSGEQAGIYAKTLLEEKGLRNNSGKEGKLELYCTDSVELFSENVESFLGHNTNALISQCVL